MKINGFTMDFSICVMGIVLELRCPRSVDGISIDPEPNWNFDSLVSEIASVEKKLNAFSKFPQPLTKTTLRNGRSSRGFVMRVSFDEMESDEDEKEEEEHLSQATDNTASKGTFSDLDNLSMANITVCSLLFKQWCLFRKSNPFTLISASSSGAVKKPNETRVYISERQLFSPHESEGKPPISADSDVKVLHGTTCCSASQIVGCSKSLSFKSCTTRNSL